MSHTCLYILGAFTLPVYHLMSPAQIPVHSLCRCVNKQILIWISCVTPMLVLLPALLTHASGPGTWHGHVEAPCCWEALLAGMLLCDWRKPDWDEWALYIEQEAWGTALVRPLSHSLSLVLCSAPFLPHNTHTHTQWDTMFVSPLPLFFSLYTCMPFVIPLAVRRRSLNYK